MDGMVVAMFRAMVSCGAGRKVFNFKTTAIGRLLQTQFPSDHQ